MYYNVIERKTPSQALGTDVNFTKVIFRPILIGLKTVELIGSWSRRGPQTFIQSCQEKIQQSRS